MRPSHAIMGRNAPRRSPHVIAKTATPRTSRLAMTAARATGGSRKRHSATPTPAVRKSHWAKTSAWRWTVTVASAREKPSFP